MTLPSVETSRADSTAELSRLDYVDEWGLRLAVPTLGFGVGDDPGAFDGPQGRCTAIPVAGREEAACLPITARTSPPGDRLYADAACTERVGRAFGPDDYDQIALVRDANCPTIGALTTQELVDVFERGAAYDGPVWALVEGAGCVQDERNDAFDYFRLGASALDELPLITLE